MTRLDVVDAIEGGFSQPQQGMSHFNSEGMFFSRSARVTGKAAPKGVAVGATRIAIARFLKQYKGVNDITVKVFRTYEEAHGKPAPFGTKGGYDPKKDTLFIYTEALDALADLNETLRHDGLVHKGLGFVDPAVF